MKVIILAAGKGSRLGNATGDLPKLFLNVNGKTIFEYQIEALKPCIESGIVDREVTLVLGYGFSGEQDHKLQEYTEMFEEIDYDIEYIENWHEVENSYSALCGVENIGDTQSILLLCGDIIVSSQQMNAIIKRYNDEIEPKGYSAVTAIEGHQEGMTAVRWDKNHLICEYGSIRGHQECGIFILHKDHINAAKAIWEDSSEDSWFPVVFPEVDSKVIKVDKEDHIEINTTTHLEDAKQTLPFR